MHLYHLTLKRSSSATESIIGNFGGSKSQEIVVSHGNSIELFSLVDGRLVSQVTSNVFGIIRSIAPFRLIGGSKGTLSHYNSQPADYIVIGSDSGRIVVLEYIPESNSFQKIHQETFGKTGCRRIVPGQYVACDPKGRAVMISAIEKQKLVYILNRDADAKPTINSPLEYSKLNLITFHLVALDVGYENPVFAALEVDTAEYLEDQTSPENFEKKLSYYELDLGLNHVVKRWSATVDRSANYLIPLPGGQDGPSGVLVCSKNKITYFHNDVDPVSVSIPRRPLSHRSHMDDVLITTATVHKLKKTFFVFAQTEDGDIFKVTVTLVNKNGEVMMHRGDQTANVILRIKFLDTIPNSNSLNIFKTGFLFSSSEKENHGLYQIENLGDDDDTEIEYSSTEPHPDPSFNPRPLRNISLVDEITSLNPLIFAQAHNLTMEDTPQIYALTGTGINSSMKVLRNGLIVNELASSELPAPATKIWTTKSSVNDKNDSYIVVSFQNATLVLSIGETVEEVTDSGLLTNTSTLCVRQIGEDSLLQVYPGGIRHRRATKRVSEWKCPTGKHIVHADANNRQVIVALSSAELVYFELDSTGNLNEYQERKEMSAPVTSISLGPLPKGRIRTKFLAIGCADSTARILSLDPDKTLESIGLQALNSLPHSVRICNIDDEASSKGLSGLYLYVGLQNGVLVRSSMDDITGQISDTRMRFLGTRAVQLSPVKINSPSENALLCMSSKTWLSYLWRTRNRLMNLDYEAFDDCCGFENEMVGQGIVGIVGNTLRIVSIGNLGEDLTQTSIQLKYTPRKFLVHPTSGFFVVMQSEYNTACFSQRQKPVDDDQEMEVDDAENLESIFGYQRSQNGWASCIQLINPTQGKTLLEIELDQNEAAFSMCIIKFSSDPNTYFLLGTAQNVVLTPRSCIAGFLRLYRFDEQGISLEQIHTTPVEGVPYAIAQYQDQILVGIGNVLRMYGMGKKKLLRKCETSDFPNMITDIKTYGPRICVSDIQESLHMATYKQQENRIIIFADDSLPRFITSFTFVDYDTVAGGDKFGNIFVSRLPVDVREDVEDDPTGNLLVRDMGFLNGAASRFSRLAEFFVGDSITSVQKVSLRPGAKEVLLYTTLFGQIGVLCPLSTKDDVDFFTNLEIQMRSLGSSLAGRDHMSFRGSFVPVKAVVDGDLVEEFLLLAPEKRRSIANELDRSAVEVVKKLEDIRGRLAF